MSILVLMRILGIETSADETAAAVVEDGAKLLSNVVASSLDLHKVYGGIVPEIAARSHIELIIPVINEALETAFNVRSGSNKQRVTSNRHVTSYMLPITRSDPWDQIDAIAVTQGPGLLGSLLIGVMTARTLAIAKNKPLIPVNHVLAHVYANFLTSTSNMLMLPGLPLQQEQPRFPLLALIVSGGHTSLLLFTGSDPVKQRHRKYKLLGQTLDDAVGEAFDKVAQILGLAYPGGPSVAEAAKQGHPKAFKLPTAKLINPYDFSFSGLKTAVLRAAQKAAGKDFTFPSSKLPKALNKAQKADLAASFQFTAVATLVDALERAADEFQPKSVVIGGGVAANQELRKQISARLSGPIFYPDPKLCTDNAAMIAALAFFQSAKVNPKKLAPDPSLSL